MPMFLLQSLLLMAAAYFLGAWIGCLVRRTFFPLPAREAAPMLREAVATPAAAGVAAPISAPQRYPDPVRSAAGAPATTVNMEPDTIRFERALEAPPAARAQPVQPAPIPTPASPVMAPLSKVEPVAPAPEAKPAVVVPKPATTVAPATPAALPVTPIAPPIPAAPEAAGMEVAKPAATPIATAAVSAATAPAYKPEPTMPAAKVVDGPREIVRASAAEQIPAAAASGAAAAAVAAGIAAAARAAVASPSIVQDTKAPAAPSAQTIADAARSAAAAATAAVSPVVPASVTAVPKTTTVMPVAGGSAGQTSVAATMAPAAEPVRAPAGAATSIPPTSSTATPEDDFTRIRAIDADLASRLRSLGLKRYADIASLKAGDIASLSATLGMKGRIEQENWIEQAEILARGGETLYARRTADARLTPVVTPPADEGIRKPLVPATAAPVVARPIPVATAPVAAPVATPDAKPVVIKPAGPAAASPKPADPAATMAATAGVAGSAMVASAAASPPTAPLPQALGSRDSLQRIAGINDSVERLLNVQGVNRYAQIAGWSNDDVTRFDRLLGREGRIRAENWIEQSQILARGGETAYSREFDRLQRAAKPGASGTASTPQPAPAAATPAAAPATSAVTSAPKAPTSPATPAPAPAAAATAVAPKPPAAPAPSAPAPVTAPAGSAPVGAAVTAVASAVVAATSTPKAPTSPATPAPAPAAAAPAVAPKPPAAPAPVSDPPRPARLIDAIRTDERVSTPTPRGDLSGLRSVRSEAYRTVEQANTSAAAAATAAGMAAARAVRPTGSDDLKRIRGIGVLIEKKLNTMGFSTYQQVASWTNDDVLRVSQALDFKGRIERENWIEQARILSSGGQTEFSRRVDRGEVPTSSKPE